MHKYEVNEKIHKSMIKSSRMRCAGHAARMGDLKNSYMILA
jgi:hypothetical protein